MGIVSIIEKLLQKCHAYFVHSPKKHLEFTKLTNMMETKGLKMLMNMKTRWVSVLDPLRRILSKDRPLLAKMSMDSNNNQTTKVTFCPKLLYVSYIVCYLLQCLLHILIDGLVAFAG